jgi:O-antigen ligase
MGALTNGLDGVSRGMVWLAILMSPFLALGGGLGFQAAGGLIGIATILVWTTDRTGGDYLKSLWPIGLIIFAGWAWLTTLWSPYDGDIIGGNASLLFILTLVLLFVPLAFLRFTDQFKTKLTWTVIIFGVLGVALTLLDTANDYAISIWIDPVGPGEDPVQRNSDAEMNVGRGQVSYALLAWPIAGLMMSRLKHGLWLAVAMLVGLAVSAQLNNLSIVIPTLAFSAAFAALGWRNQRLGIILAFVLAICSLAFAPLLGFVSSLVDADMMRKLPLSWEHRVRMWAYSWELIQQTPWIGHGFDASRVFDQRTFRVPDGRDIPVISMHPHNIGLQIWLETGLIGVILIVGTLVALLKTTLKICQGSLQSMAVAGLVAATATCSAVTVGVWQHWWWALIILAASLIILLPSERMNRT